EAVRDFLSAGCPTRGVPCVEGYYPEETMSKPTQKYLFLHRSQPGGETQDINGPASSSGSSSGSTGGDGSTDSADGASSSDTGGASDTGADSDFDAAQCVGSYPLVDGGLRFCAPEHCYCGGKDACFAKSIAGR